MAKDLMSKSNIFDSSSSCCYSGHHRHHDKIYYKYTHNRFGCKSTLFPSLKFQSSSSSSYSDYHGRSRVVVKGLESGIGMPWRMMMMMSNSQAAAASSSNPITLPHPHPQMSVGIGRAQKWWEKGVQPNMKEVKGAQDFVDSLLNAGDALVVVDFFSPGCGGCRALHPKICQIAEMNPDVQFVQVNYEEHKSMCYTLNIHVLPFFRFYRGAQGRLCSFSCTNATIKKFKDALAKHSPDRCSIGPTKGLEEKELVALAANKDLTFNYTPKTEKQIPIPIHIPIPSQEKEKEKEKILLAAEEAAAPSPPIPSASNSGPPLPLPLPLPLSSMTSSKEVKDSGDKSLVTASGR